MQLSKAELSGLFRSMDQDRDGFVTWLEFHDWVAWEVAAGQEVLDDLVTPTGVRMPLTAMVQKARGHMCGRRGDRARAVAQPFPFRTEAPCG